MMHRKEHWENIVEVQILKDLQTQLPTFFSATFHII